ncbi:MAG: hypothetical protein HGA36_01690 [Candidatus Moranbacteria bacterium]|nr:hypothetical protein [Candidatus Moranbacteria bacterium]
MLEKTTTLDGVIMKNDEKKLHLSASIATQLSAAIIRREADEAIGPRNMAEVIAAKNNFADLPTTPEEVRAWKRQRPGNPHPELAFPGIISDS